MDDYPQVGFSQGINTPDIKLPSLQPRIRAVEDASQAYLIAKNIVVSSAAEQRNLKNARILSKYNDDPPYNDKELQESGNDWMSNFSSGFLSSVVDQVFPRFFKAAQSLRYLTMAALPLTDDKGIPTPGADQKTARFREVVTSTIRRWPGWTKFLASLALETTLLGSSFSIWLDKYQWRPTFFKQDSAFVPEGNGQEPNETQWLVVRHEYMIHELLEKIKDKEAAEAAGWGVENVVQAVNEAYPKNPLRDPQTNYRAYQDLFRETTVGTAYVYSAKTIASFHIFAQEADGPVTHYITRQQDGLKLFKQDDQFEEMANTVTLVTYQAGDLNFYGSKGLGRLLFNNHLAIERARNRILDQVFLSGLRTIKTDASNRDRVECQVTSPFIVVDNAFTFEEQAFEADVNGFILLDNHLTGIAQQKAGAYSPVAPSLLPNMPKQTATGQNIAESYRQETNDILLSRFLRYVSDIVFQIQKKMMDPETIDEIALDAQKELLQIMSRKELDTLMNTPASERIEDYDASQDAKVLAWLAAHKGDPNVNQYVGLKKEATIMMGPEETAELVLPQNDPTVLSENVRQQMSESALVRGGVVPPVSPRDNHFIHMDYEIDEINQIEQKIAQGDLSSAPFAQGLLAHFELHLEAVAKAGYKPKDYQKYIDFYKDASKKLQEFQQQLSQHVGTQIGAAAAQRDLSQIPATALAGAPPIEGNQSVNSTTENIPNGQSTTQPQQGTL